MNGLPLGTEEQFALDVKDVQPLLKRMHDAMNGNRNALTGQRFQMEANQQILNRQNADISANREVLEEHKAKAAAIVAAADARAKEIEKGIVERAAQANHKDREATKKLQEADKILWQAREKTKEKVAA